MARQPFGTVFGWPLAIFGWPMWLAMLNLLSGNLWHLERRAMIAIRARETSRFPALHLLGGPLVIGRGSATKTRRFSSQRRRRSTKDPDFCTTYEFI